jgi:predicted transcriptional regulator
LSLFSAFRSNSELQERVEKLERELRVVQLDWDELYAKCKKLLGRVAKERATMEKLEPENAPAETELSPGEPSRFGGLTPRQRELQQQILRRRAGVR